MLKKMPLGLIPQELIGVCEALRAAGGQAWLVGGSIRDLLLGLAPHDWDVEVYGLEASLLDVELQKLGHCQHVGKHFGVSKLWLGELGIDIALPRTEIKTGRGHKGFDVASDACISPEQAVLRRDFTMNAMMYDPLSHELLDFHHGLKDLKAKVLRHVSDAFVEDPLRPLRAMQFAARYQLTLDDETKDMCRSLLGEASTLPKERVWHEWLKWAQSGYPSYGLSVLADTGWLSCYPELQSLVGCPQHQRWHPEGDVWVHTCLVVDEAAKLKVERALSEHEGLVLMFAALCHDMGKPKATYVDTNGEVLAPNHGIIGEEPSKRFLDAILMPKHLKRQVLPLVRNHVIHFEESLEKSSVLKLADRLEPVHIGLWEILTEADASGCPPIPPSRPAHEWLRLAQLLGVTKGRSEPIVTGNMLIDWGVRPSPQLGSILEQAYDAQLNGIFKSEASAYTWFKKNAVATQGK